MFWKSPQIWQELRKAHYFIAYGNTPNYNNSDGLDLTASFEKSQKALEEAQNSDVIIIISTV